jgi:hypothetical protein
MQRKNCENFTQIFFEIFVTGQRVSDAETDGFCGLYKKEISCCIALFEKQNKEHA